MQPASSGEGTGAGGNLYKDFFCCRYTTLACSGDLLVILIPPTQRSTLSFFPEINVLRFNFLTTSILLGDSLSQEYFAMFPQRLFFLNGEQDLSAFLLSDLGLIKFPDYTCTITQPIFQSRSDLLQYEEVSPDPSLFSFSFCSRSFSLEVFLSIFVQ